jgi:hypothetical protein
MKDFDDITMHGTTIKKSVGIFVQLQFSILSVVYFKRVKDITYVIYIHFFLFQVSIFCQEGNFSFLCLSL